MPTAEAKDRIASECLDRWVKWCRDNGASPKDIKAIKLKGRKAIMKAHKK